MKFFVVAIILALATTAVAPLAQAHRLTHARQERWYDSLNALSLTWSFHRSIKMRWERIDDGGRASSTLLSPSEMLNSTAQKNPVFHTFLNKPIDVLSSISPMSSALTYTIFFKSVTMPILYLSARFLVCGDDKLVLWSVGHLILHGIITSNLKPWSVWNDIAGLFASTWKNWQDWTLCSLLRPNPVRDWVEQTWKGAVTRIVALLIGNIALFSGRMILDWEIIVAGGDWCWWVLFRWNYAVAFQCGRRFRFLFEHQISSMIVLRCFSKIVVLFQMQC